MIEVKKTVCPHDCPDTCSIVATLEEGRVLRCEGDPDHPFTQGFLCDKVRRYPERIYSSERILYPLRRVGRKGEGRFVRIPWDEALDEIAARFKTIIAEFGAAAILPFHYGGTLGLVQNNAGSGFFHRLGASMILKTICDTGSTEAWVATYGEVVGTDPEAAVESDFVVIWGMNAAVTNLHGMPFMLEAKRRGAKLVVVDPYRNETAKLADQHLRPRAGTDAALALGVARVWIEENLWDKNFVDRWTFGFEAFRQRVMQEYSLERCAEICGVDANVIRKFAREYTKARAPFLRLGIGFARHPNGGQAFRAVCILPGLVGAFEKRGGGAVYATSGAYEVFWHAVKRPDLAPRTPRLINMIRLGEALTTLNDPPIQALYVYNCNPAAIIPNQNLILRRLRSEDLFTVVHEQMNTDTVDYADIVLPATTSFEHFDVYKSYGHYYLQLAQPVLPPQGEAKSNWEVFQLLAARMGFTDEHFSKSAEQIARELLAPSSRFRQGISFEVLEDGEPHRLKVDRFANPFPNGFATETGKLEIWSKRLEKQGKDPLPAYVPNPEGHENGGNGSRYPFQLLTPPSRHMLNTSFGSVETLRRRAKKPRVKINPSDARALQIGQDDFVRVFNSRGEVFLHAEITEEVPEGLLVAESVWWTKHSPERRGINALTSDALADLGGGPTFHSALVDLEKFHRPL